MSWTRSSSSGCCARSRARWGIDDDKLKRAVNAGFSGGEKKRNEILQMALAGGRRMAVMDETG